MAGIEVINQKVREQSAFVSTLKAEIGKVIVGQDYLIDRLIIGMLSNGHVLLEGVPGLAKTLTINTLASALDTSFQRIQFTPDLLPADLIGTLIYNQKDGDFIIKKGPVFANVILADEINRAPAKVQSALLESMQEKQVTIGDETFPLPKPFLVMATENPIEQEGTYPLPEAQVDRFMLKLKVGYPTLEEERRILDRMAHSNTEIPINAVLHPDEILKARELVDEIYIDEKIKDYILSIVFATREPAQYNLDIGDYLRYGASPRATIFLTMGARAHAFMQGRGYVTPQDVKSIAPDVLRHRIIVSYEAEAEEMTSEDLINIVLSEIPVP
ncbi:MAG: MoxR family ATPase [Kiritimatiellales bacterium]|nr:MoxR family ATPase [Pontiella sp.]NNJ71028.1 MoxR family ATPase [Kiritimatiellales bacterium]